ncbi:DNA-binding response regulator [Paenibacillus sp. 598K]|uniref:response regulator transcription factor n=1 Tax=Paenibacillus sp. 598K TaxID=1117987 RepID=UPI000FF954B5|nr:response regulator [Paenibacillus sp. 598K]GBF77704.1 DNA-binding response regulator [Paenibacillus sp. 598K]
MYRLLIVDDLPIITDGLVELFEKQADMALEVYKAYSGIEALELLGRHRIDIVMTDILMPGMDGIELLRQIRASWPGCKVIMLTSHSDFKYVQDAMSLGGLGYILKTEDDDTILQAVRKACEALDKEHGARQLIDKAQEHMRMALPALQQEYLWFLLQGKKVGQAVLREHFAHIQLPFDAELPVMLLICRVDDWNEVTTAPDKALLVYAVQNIAEEFLGESMQLISIVYEQSRMVWILQPPGGEADSWERSVSYVNGLMEMIQSRCEQLLKLSISFVLGSQPVDWNELADRFHALKFLLVRGIGGQRGSLLTDHRPESGEQAQGNSEDGGGYSGGASNYQLQAKLPMLMNSLENGNEAEYYPLYAELTVIFTDEQVSPLRKLELYHALSFLFLSFVNKYNLERELAGEIDWGKLAHFDAEVSWSEWNDFFLQAADRIMRWTRNEQEQSTRDIVGKIHAFIERHVATNLSLVQIADFLDLNPSYLSRLYKQITGNALSDYIVEFRDRKAKELLKKSNLKVYAIAAELGYNSSHAFIRFFKKQNRITPQEYRDQWGTP